MNDRVAADEELLTQAQGRGPFATLKAFVRLSGPGWLQSAITLGGGSLASALYLGVLSGYSMLWLQVLAMLLGVVMLSAIGYVTLSTGQQPFRAIRDHVNPVLAWGWLLAVLLANVVWALPQFALGTAAVQQNLLPSVGDGNASKAIICAVILVTATAVVFAYDKGARGVRIFEGILKAMVGVVVLCFFGVVATLALQGGGLPWGEIAAGLVPDLGLLSRPAATFEPYLEGAGNARSWWEARIVGQQRDVMIAAAATAVGINMTFLLPYSMLRKGWNARFRGLAIFDLGTGLLIPFVVATGCVVIAAANRFHAQADVALVDDPRVAMESAAYLDNLDARLAHGFQDEDSYQANSVRSRLRPLMGDFAFEQRLTRAMNLLPRADRELSAMLIKRDAFSLATALEPLTGSTVSRVVFGVGVLGMAVSTVIILMLISGFAFCELFGVEPRGWPHRAGALVAGLGVLGPFVWTGQAKFYLAVPTSNFGMVLLPIAYWTFFLMMNSRRLLGEHLPRGANRVVWNTLMLIAAGIATFASVVTVRAKVGWYGLGGMLAFLGLALIVHFVRPRRGSASAVSGE